MINLMRIALILLFFCAKAAYCQSTSEMISVSATLISSAKNNVRLTIVNRDSFPHIVFIKIFNKEPDGDLVAHTTTTALPNSSSFIEVPPNPGKKYSQSITWSYYENIGDNTVVDKDRKFLIPFHAESEFKVCQSSDGPQTTHKLLDRLYAIDFCAKEKTPILAAKDGVIFELIQNFTESGVKSDLLGKENKISILHSDGLISTYAHISPNSSPLSVGDKVLKGQQIALVGHVGYSSGPHLHFEVLEGDVKLNSQNNLINVIPVEFLNSKGEKIIFKYGISYSGAGAVLKNRSFRRPL